MGITASALPACQATGRSSEKMGRESTFVNHPALNKYKMLLLLRHFPCAVYFQRLLYTSSSQLNSRPRCPGRWEGSKCRPRLCLQPRTVMSVAFFHGQTPHCGQSPAYVPAGHKGEDEHVNGRVETGLHARSPVCWFWTSFGPTLPRLSPRVSNVDASA